MLNPKKLVKSFYCAGRGLVNIIKTEQNFRIEIFGMIFIVFWMFYFNISWIKIVFIGILFLLILSFEIINTIFEEITDFLAKERPKNLFVTEKGADLQQNSHIGYIKDLAAALVLFVCIISIFLAIAILLKI